MSKESKVVKDEVMVALVHSVDCEQCRAKLCGALAYMGMMAMECADHAREVKV